MDAKKAIKELSYNNTDYGGKCTQEVRKAAIRALEKQVPMKPITYNETNRADCPVCKSTVRGINVPFGDYCANCGQRLDWKER